MKQEQIKAILVNILTAAVIIGVLIAGYVVFIKQAVPTVTEVSTVAKIAEETAQVGTEIDTTVRDLGDLSSAIANSAVIFDLPAFKNLQDFTVQIPYQAVGRDNPFTPTSPFSQLLNQNIMVSQPSNTSSSHQNVSTTGGATAAPVSTPSKQTAVTPAAPVVPVTPAVPVYNYSSTSTSAPAIETPTTGTASNPVLTPPALPSTGQ